MRRQGKFLIAVLAATLLFTMPADARRTRPMAQPADTNSSYATQQIVVPLGKSRVVDLGRSFRQVVVGSKDIASVVPLGRGSVYVLGKAIGTTNLSISDASKHVVAVVDIVVTYDIDGLKQELARLVPGNHIEISPAGQSLVLSGSVASADRLHRAVELAQRYAGGNVTNLITISGSQQVMLSVKFAEVERSAIQDLGINVLNGNAVSRGGLVPNASLPATIGEFGTYGGLLTDLSTFDLRAKLQAMETRGLVRTLAEPNLVALSGQTASFLAGGEFPIPAVQTTTGTTPTITIEYKDFGVGLSFTPTVLTSDGLDLAMKSEVSAIDPTNSVTASGISIPGFKVRRAKTTVELRDGQTFAIAGLIQNDFEDTINAVPGLGDVPILGALFRSTHFKHNETELVVFITVHLVKPVPRGTISLPTDKVSPPTLSDLDVMGKTEGPAPAMHQNATEQPPKSQGYVLP